MEDYVPRREFDDLVARVRALEDAISCMRCPERLDYMPPDMTCIHTLGHTGAHEQHIPMGGGRVQLVNW